MNLELFLGSKTKVDILKYLLFNQEWVSARELESKLNYSFPAIKKQVDNLEKAWILNKNQKWNKWQIIINSDVKPLIMDLFLYNIKSTLKNIFIENDTFLIKCFLVDFFSNEEKKLWVDMVFVHKDVEDIFLQDIKKHISWFLDDYFLELKIVFISKREYEKRLKFADKFIINISKYPTL